MLNQPLIDVTGNNIIEVSQAVSRWFIDVESESGTGTITVQYQPPGTSVWKDLGDDAVLDLSDANVPGIEVPCRAQAFKFTSSNGTDTYSAYANDA